MTAITGTHREGSTGDTQRIGEVRAGRPLQSLTVDSLPAWRSSGFKGKL